MIKKFVKALKTRKKIYERTEKEMDFHKALKGKYDQVRGRFILEDGRKGIVIIWFFENGNVKRISVSINSHTSIYTKNSERDFNTIPDSEWDIIQNKTIYENPEIYDLEIEKVDYFLTKLSCYSA